MLNGYRWTDLATGRLMEIDTKGGALCLTALTGDGEPDPEIERREILRLAGQLDVQYRSLTIWQKRALKAESNETGDRIRDLEADVAAAERRFRVAEAEIDARRRRQEELEAEVFAIGRREWQLYKFLDERNAAAEKAEAENKKLLAALDGMARILKSLEPVG